MERSIWITIIGRNYIGTFTEKLKKMSSLDCITRNLKQENAMFNFSESINDMNVINTDFKIRFRSFSWSYLFHCLHFWSHIISCELYLRMNFCNSILSMLQNRMWNANSSDYECETNFDVSHINKLFLKNNMYRRCSIE